MTENFLLSVAAQFSDSVKQIAPLGHGLINDTYLVDTAGLSFVLQKINHQVFPEPALIMANLQQLTAHTKSQQKQLDPLIIPALVKTQSHHDYYQDNQGDYWRALSFIDNSESLETLRTLGDAKQAGLALGRFHRMVSDLDPALLHDTLPGFHITPGYLAHYQRVQESLNQPSFNPVSRYCAAFIETHQAMANDLEQAKYDGLLTTRVIHGDPKLNNFLFDRHSQEIISIIDLDTVKPGLVHYDIGDCLRSCCHTADDEFDLDICAALLQAYLEIAGDFFNVHDYDFLYPAIRLIPFELGIRFYSDYLEGNRYFKVTDPEQNLHRAAQQFRLCESIMRQEQRIRRLL